MKYKVGEICEARSMRGVWEGYRECEIKEVGPSLPTRAGTLRDYYCEITGDPKLYGVDESYLRKKRPSSDGMERGRWEECPWVPDEIFSSWPAKLEI